MALNKIKIFILMLSVLLTGCATPMQNQGNLEVQAWQRLDQRATTECLKGKTPEDITKKQAVKFTKCVDGIINQEVLPVALFPDLLMQTRAEAAKDSASYAAGKLSKEEWIANGRARGARYFSELDTRVRNDAAVRQQAFANAMQNIQQQQYMQQQQAYQQQQLFNQQMMINNMNRPVQTNCHRYGYNVSCTTY